MDRSTENVRVVTVLMASCLTAVIMVRDMVEVAIVGVDADRALVATVATSSLRTDAISAAINCVIGNSIRRKQADGTLSRGDLYI